MIVCELLALKFRELFGAQYKVFVEDAFNDEFTTSVDGHFGQQLAINDKAYNMYKDKIVAVVKVNNPTRANVDYFYMGGSYSIDFFVPVNFIKRDSNGILLENPKFNFYGDCLKVIDIINNKQVKFYNNKYGRMTMSEPYGVSATLIESTPYKRKQIRVTGNFAITDKGIFGGDTVYAIEIDNQFELLKNVNSINNSTNYNSNSINDSDTIQTKLKTVQSENALVLSVEDINTDNKAFNKIKDINRYKPDEITPNAIPKHRIKKIRTGIVYPNNDRKTYWTIPNIDYSATKMGIGSYTTTLYDDGIKDTGEQIGFANMSYELLDLAAHAIDIGESRIIKLKDNTEYKFTILDKNINKLASGGKARLTVMLEGLLDTDYIWGSGNEGGWRDSTIRATLNNEIFNLLPDELQKIIKSVIITTVNDGTGNEAVSSNTEDKLFLLSATEVFDRPFNQQSGVSYGVREGKQYEYFVNNNPIAFRSGQTPPFGTEYWLRTKHSTNTTQAALVSSIGTFNSGLLTSNLKAIRFLFCI